LVIVLVTQGYHLLRRNSVHDILALFCLLWIAHAAETARMALTLGSSAQ